MRVAVGCPVRNRRWILPYYLSAISKLRPTADSVFVVANMDEPAICIIRDEGAIISLGVDDIPDDTDEAGRRLGNIRNSVGYAHLSKMRNELLHYAATMHYDYLFSVDSDIIVEPVVLERLIAVSTEYGGAVVSTIIFNDYGEGKRCNIMRYSGRETLPYTHIMDWEKDRVIDVDLTGACILIPRKVLQDESIRYGPSALGRTIAEDAGFCEGVKKAGIPLLCDTRIMARHVMRADDL